VAKKKKYIPYIGKRKFDASGRPPVLKHGDLVELGEHRLLCGDSSKPANIKYAEIGWVSSSGGMVHEWTHLIEAMQQKAASKGANAIIIVAGERPNTGMATYTPQYGLLASQGTQKSMTAIAIRILD